jgi:hypothetical protein
MPMRTSQKVPRRNSKEVFSFGGVTGGLGGVGRGAVNSFELTGDAFGAIGGVVGCSGVLSERAAGVGLGVDCAAGAGAGGAGVFEIMGGIGGGCSTFGRTIFGGTAGFAASAVIRSPN